MTDTIKLVGRLRAFERGRAVRAASHLQVAIQAHALVICPLAMAGEDTTIHAIAIGGIGTAPQIKIVPDPRVRDAQYELIAWIGGILEDYYRERRTVGQFPQIIVSSSAAAGQLDILADRLRFTRDAPAIKRTGDLLTYVTERLPVAGQQALLTVTGMLSEHYCTGQQDGEDEHLGVFLTWLQPPAGVDLWRSIERAEGQVMGVKTDPEFDRTQLSPLLSNYNRVRKSGASAAQIQRRANAIDAALRPIVENIYNAVQTGLSFLQGQFPPALILSDLEQQEASSFESFMQSRDNGHPLPYRDKPKAAAFKITEREVAIQNTERAALYGDEVAQARARLAGKIISGVSLNATVTKTGPRKFVHRFVVETLQTNLHLRSGDTFAGLNDPRLCCAVEAVHRVGAVSHISFKVTKGMRSPGTPANGTALEFAPPPPDWFQIIRTRKKMALRLAQTPWTHGEVVPPTNPPSAVARPANLLAAVEQLR